MRKSRTAVPAPRVLHREVFPRKAVFREPVGDVVRRPRGNRDIESPPAGLVRRVAELLVDERDLLGDDVVIGDVGRLVRSAVPRAGTEPAFMVEVEIVNRVPGQGVASRDFVNLPLSRLVSSRAKGLGQEWGRAEYNPDHRRNGCNPAAEPASGRAVRADPGSIRDWLAPRPRRELRDRQRRSPAHVIESPAELSERRVSPRSCYHVATSVGCGGRIRRHVGSVLFAGFTSG